MGSITARFAMTPPLSHAPALFFDRASALERVDQDETLLREIAQIFLETCDEMIQEVLSAAANRDAAALHMSAHSLKGAAANFGAVGTVDAAFALEHKGRMGDLTNLDASLLSLQVALSGLRGALESYVASAAAST